VPDDPTPEMASRTALIRTMRTLLRRQGYAATGLKQVLTDSGVTTGSLYHHFPGGKQELAEAALTASGRSVGAALAHLLDTSDTCADAIAAWTDAMAAALAVDPRDGCPVMPAAVEAVHASEPLRRAAGTAFLHWRDLLAERLGREGVPTDEATETATAVVALLEGALLLARTTGDPSALRAARRAAVGLLSAAG
jgi:TetR/AcrR family transcriptional regulator, lmrAB and yxaGH operons repressor